MSIPRAGARRTWRRPTSGTLSDPKGPSPTASWNVQPAGSCGTEHPLWRQQPSRFGDRRPRRAEISLRGLKQLRTGNSFPSKQVVVGSIPIPRSSMFPLDHCDQPAAAQTRGQVLGRTLF